MAPPKKKANAAAESMSVGVNHNEDVTSKLAELGKLEAEKGDLIRARAYRTAVHALKTLDHRVENGKAARKLKGIGPKIAAKIDEIRSSGRLGTLDRAMADDNIKALHTISAVSGIGPVAAKKFVLDLGVRTLDDLAKHPLNHHQQIGLKHHADLVQKIPREEMHLLRNVIQHCVAAVDPELKMTVCGSYRRGAAKSGDIDVLVTHQSPVYVSEIASGGFLAKIEAEMIKMKFATDRLSLGNTKYMGVCRLSKDIVDLVNGTKTEKQTGNGDDDSNDDSNDGDGDDVLPKAKKRARPSPDTDTDTDNNNNSNNNNDSYLHRRIDIRVVPSEAYPTATLYFTGSDLFNQQMREHANNQGFTINEYSIRPVGVTGVKGDAVEVESEEDVFAVVGMEYVPPTSRNY